MLFYNLNNMYKIKFDKAHRIKFDKTHRIKLNHYISLTFLIVYFNDLSIKSMKKIKLM